MNMHSVTDVRGGTVAWHGLSAGAAVGAVVWLGGVAVLRPALTDRRWAEAILMLATLVLFPLALKLARADEEPADRRLVRMIILLHLPTALLLGWALLREPSTWSAALAIPWLSTLTLTAILGLRRLWRHRDWLSAAACVDLSLVYVWVGGLWAVLDRYGARPLDFEPVIVLLTAIHFHYAGFVLPLLTGLAAGPLSPRRQAVIAVGVLAGVPLVAIGITTSQLGLSPIVESVAALWLTLAAALVAVLHLRLTTDYRWSRSVRLLWGTAGVALLASMSLAALYGLRAYWPLARLDIPNMRAWHGTANALGFALPATLGWLLAIRGERSLVRDTKVRYK